VLSGFLNPGGGLLRKLSIVEYLSIRIYLFEICSIWSSEVGSVARWGHTVRRKCHTIGEKSEMFQRSFQWKALGIL